MNKSAYNEAQADAEIAFLNVGHCEKYRANYILHVNDFVPSAKNIGPQIHKYIYGKKEATKWLEKSLVGLAQNKISA